MLTRDRTPNEGSEVRINLAGALLGEWRKRAGLTQKELAKRLKRSVNTIVSWENGRRPFSKTLSESFFDVADALGRTAPEDLESLGGVLRAEMFLRELLKADPASVPPMMKSNPPSLTTLHWLIRFFYGRREDREVADLSTIVVVRQKLFEVVSKAVVEGCPPDDLEPLLSALGRSGHEADKGFREELCKLLRTCFISADSPTTRRDLALSLCPYDCEPMLHYLRETDNSLRDRQSNLANLARIAGDGGYGVEVLSHLVALLRWHEDEGETLGSALTLRTISQLLHYGLPAGQEDRAKAEPSRFIPAPLMRELSSPACLNRPDAPLPPGHYSLTHLPNLKRAADHAESFLDHARSLSQGKLKKGHRFRQELDRLNRKLTPTYMERIEKTRGYAKQIQGEIDNFLRSVVSRVRAEASRSNTVT